jgi:hypothetical protein
MPFVDERFTAQLLAGPPARDPVAVAERLLAVQAQDLQGARLAIRARTRGLTVADVDRALTDDRSLVISWLNRGTLHLVRAEDYAWLHALTTPQLAAANLRRLDQEQVSPGMAEKGVRLVVQALAGDGPLTRPQIRDRLQAAGVRTEGAALVHILVLATLQGLVVRGPIVGKQHAFVLVRDWLGEQPRLDRDAALRELGRRFLLGHAPADEHDLAKWAGIKLTDARTALAAAGPAPRRRALAPAPKLLGQWDALLHGWRSREPVLGRHEAAVVTGGLFRPFALVGGRAVGTWSFAGGRPELAPFGRLSRAVRLALEAEAADVVRFFDGDRSSQ